jgi:hypothetical protein
VKSVNHGSSDKGGQSLAERRDNYCREVRQEAYNIDNPLNKLAYDKFQREIWALTLSEPFNKRATFIAACLDWWFTGVDPTPVLNKEQRAQWDAVLPRMEKARNQAVKRAEKAARARAGNQAPENAAAPQAGPTPAAADRPDPFITQAVETYNDVFGTTYKPREFPEEAVRGLQRARQNGHGLADVKSACEAARAKWSGHPEYITPKSVLKTNFSNLLQEPMTKRHREYPETIQCPVCGTEARHSFGVVYECPKCGMVRRSA